MRKITLLVVLMASGMLHACDNSPETLPVVEIGKRINIILSGGVDNNRTKVTYDPNGDNSVYVASWEMGDEISLLVPTTEGNDNQKFVVSNAAKISDMTGQISTWEGNKNIIAFYPFDENGYFFDPSTETILFDNTGQKIDAQAGNKYTNGLMVAVATNATANSQEEYNIGQLKFKQVMSLFELEVNDIPAGEIVTYIGFEIEEQLFVASADINPITSGITARTNTNSIRAMVDNQSGTTASLNFAVLPVDLTGKSVSLYLNTTSETETKKYTYKIPAGINFQANNFMYKPTGALSLIDDFTAAGAAMLYLADFENGFVPEGDKWVIADETSTTISFDGIKEALRTLSVQSKKVSIEFPNLTSLPDGALLLDYEYDYENNAMISLTCPKVSSIGTNALKYNGALANVSFPAATSIGDGAFYQCASLTVISFPMATTMGYQSFYQCTALTDISFPVATLIGDEAFTTCTALTTISFPVAILIEDNAFYQCSALTTISFPVATSIEASAFSSCFALTSVSFPSVTSVATSAFVSCKSLTSVSFPSATFIGMSAFRLCTRITTASLPVAISIGSNAFNGCNALHTLEMATGTSAITGKNVVIESLYADIFKMSETVTHEGNITLTIGLANKPNIVTNTLTVTGNSYTFKKINVIGGEIDFVGAVGDGVGSQW